MSLTARTSNTVTGRTSLKGAARVMSAVMCGVLLASCSQDGQSDQAGKGSEGTSELVSSVVAPTGPASEVTSAQPSLASQEATVAANASGTESTRAHAGVSPVGVADKETKLARPSTGAQLVVTGVRVGKHETFDRVVFDLAGSGSPGWFIEYTKTPAQQGSGHAVNYRGDMAINVNIDGTLMPFELGLEDPQLGTTPGTDQVVTEVISQGTFEGRSQFVVGTRGATHPFSVVVLQEPTRLVLDIHRA